MGTGKCQTVFLELLCPLPTDVSLVLLRRVSGALVELPHHLEMHGGHHLSLRDVVALLIPAAAACV